MAAKTSKNNPKDAYEVPAGVQKFTPEAKRDVVRDMLNHGGFNRQQIASLVGVSINVVTGVETQLSGKGKRIDQILAEKRAAAPHVPKTETATLDGEKVVIHDIDAKAQQRGPEPTEAKVVRLESALNDMRTDVSRVTRTVEEGFDELRGMLSGRVATSAPRDEPPMSEGPEEPERAPTRGGNGQSAEQVVINAPFEAFIERVPVSSKRRALFEMWKADTYRQSRDDPRHPPPFEGTLADFMLMTFEFFFEKEKGSLIYQRRYTDPPPEQQQQPPWYGRR